MNGKKIHITAKPSNRLSAEDWIGDKNAATGEPTKRLTIDVPKKLHARIKSQCAMRGENMAEEIRKLLEKHFPEEYQQKEGEGASPVTIPGNTTL
jgi:hypothetical protein